MDIRQLLLAIPTYPDRVADRSLEGACRLAQLLGANMTAQVWQLNPDRATWPAVLGAAPLDFPRMMQDLVNQSEANAAASCAALDGLCKAHDVKIDIRRAVSQLYASPADMVDLSRLHDLLILPVPEIESFDRSWTEAAIFQSGRPTILMPSGGKQLQSLHRVVVAWDYSREAARALADALPILRRAGEVHLVTATDEKHIATTCVAGDLEKFMTAHQLRYSIHQLAAGAESISSFLMRYAREVDAGLLVMGAYGHHRMREFVLGGASRGVIRHPALPVLLSH